MKILEFPISRITVFFTLGIIIAYFFHPNIIYIANALALTFAITVAFFLKSNRQFEQQSAFGIALCMSFFLLGITTTLLHNDTLQKNHYCTQETNFTQNHQLKFVILDKLRNTSANYRFAADLIAIDNKKATGKVLINLKKENVLLPINVGSRIAIEDQLVKNFKPNNPNQFDYGHYLETKNIYAQVFTDASKVKISDQIRKDIWFYTANFRNKIVTSLSSNGFKKEELAVIVALILGQQQDISPDVMRDYQYAGAIHILSVSGLHVGFILLFLNFLLTPLPKNKWGNITRLVIILLSLWLFAIVAGLAPSVVRSATMFSFIAIGMFLNRETNQYYNLILSLFTILLFEPLFLFDIGFQLSYTAVFFILWLEPIFKSLWTPRNNIVGYFWSILTVSFAAQIGTLPLSIYYFHQFPGLFFVTNLVLIPCLTLIMFLGLLLMLFAFFDYVPHFLAKIVEVCITLMNGFINWIASIESFIIKEIPLSFSLLLVAYLFIISCIVWIKKPSYAKLTITLISLLLFQILFFGSNWSSQNKQEWIVFNVPKRSLMAERKGKNIVLFSDDSLVENSFESKMVLSYATANFCKIKCVKRISNALSFQGSKILIIDEKSIYSTSIKPDIVVLRQSPKLNLERLIKEIHPKVIVADASNYKTNIRLWKATCLQFKVPFHSTYEKGYYSLTQRAQ
jgi:competence protein ComEC